MNIIFSRNKNALYLSQAFLAIFVGGFIYATYRTRDLLMFDWFSFIGVNHFVNSLRMINFTLPEWIIFSLPDALWVYSFTLVMLCIWNRKINKMSVLWIFTPVFLGVTGEFLQLFFVPGTFDLTDLTLCLFAGLPAVFLTK